MKRGDTYRAFDCTWIVDNVYKVNPELMERYDLVYPVRYTAHVISAPAGYAGVRNVDAALTEIKYGNVTFKEVFI